MRAQDHLEVAERMGLHAAGMVRNAYLDGDDRDYSVYWHTRLAAHHARAVLIARALGDSK